LGIPWDPPSPASTTEHVDSWVSLLGHRPKALIVSGVVVVEAEQNDASMGILDIPLPLRCI
jgi:hypothetical protein